MNKLVYKNFVWPQNPDVYEQRYVREPVYTKDEDGKLNIEGKWSMGLSKLNSSSLGEGTFKIFTYDDKYVLIQYGFQQFVLCMMKDARGRIVNKAKQFERLAQEADNDAKAAIDKKYPPVQPRKFNK